MTITRNRPLEDELAEGLDIEEVLSMSRETQSDLLEARREARLDANRLSAEQEYARRAALRRAGQSLRTGAARGNGQYDDYMEIDGDSPPPRPPQQPQQYQQPWPPVVQAPQNVEVADQNLNRVNKLGSKLNSGLKLKDRLELNNKLGLNSKLKQNDNIRLYSKLGLNSKLKQNDKLRLSTKLELRPRLGLYKIISSKLRLNMMLALGRI
ncbi:hypothetical protein D6C78_08624 [Aureobasidium pullulans]|uniref:Uncharacterized protein n=1 Tax=Aureobasidium pullulans TaxID=5580 RepID=A0A4T0BE88_AURPU|nr:hypothetical protein D6C78_08624 [Aureobasidium pullulans]